MNAVILSLAVLLCECYSAKILGFIPFYGTSHHRVILPLFAELATRGHNVTVASFFEPGHHTMHPKYKGVQNYKTILFQPKNGTPLRGFLQAETFTNSNFMTTMTMLDDIVGDYDVIIEKNSFERIFEEKYDLVIAEFFESDLFVAYVARCGAPFILIHPSEPYPWHRDPLGDPISPSIIPVAFGQHSSDMDFSGRFWNTLELIQMMIYYRTVVLQTAQTIAEKYLGPQPPLYELTKNASLYMTNTHNSLFGPRPMNPSTIEVGGLHVFPPNSLPNDLKALLDGAKHGVIYFSMGSVLRGSSVSADKRDAILKVFSELKETVLWKWEEDLPYKPSNLHTSPWFPQRDVFAHPNVVLYIGHCGLLGIHEAVTEALPIICLPMFGDQHFNAAALKQNGMGLWLNYADINEDVFRNTINQVLKDPSYKENAKRVSAAFLDRPMSAMDTAVYWTEYVIRHKGAPHLRSPARWMTWYEYYNLDVIAVLATVPLLVLVLLYKMLAAFIRTLCCRGPGSGQKVKRS